MLGATFRLVAVALLASAPRVSAAQVQLPAGCGAEEQFEREVRARLSPGTPLPNIGLVIEPEGSAYLLRMRVGDEYRELRDADCRELFRAAVVVAVSSALSDGSATERKPAAASAPAAQPGSAPAVAARPSEEPSAPLRRVAASISLGGGVHAGQSPELVPSLDLEAKLSVRAFGVGLGLRYLAPASARNADGRGVEVSGVGAALYALYAPTDSLETRLGFGAFRLTGAGFGSPDERSDVAWSAGPSLGIQFFPLRRQRFSASLGLEGEWHVVRARFQILNYGEVFRVAPFGVNGLARIGYRFY